MKKLLLAAVLCAAVSTPAFAQDGDASSKEGLRVEGRVMWENLNDPVDDLGIVFEFGSGVSYGGEIGYDIAVSESVVVGPYANYELSSIEECDFDFCVGSGGYWAAGIQVGLVVGDSGMAYLKGGYGQQTIDAAGPVEVAPGVFENIEDSESGGGYNFALGYEQGFGDTFYGRAEVSISESYDIFGFDIQRGALGISLGARF